MREPYAQRVLVLPRPVTDSPSVRCLCERLVPGGIPSVLKVEIPPSSIPNDCTANVERVIGAHGGGVQLGWQLWETLPGVMIEAEFHAVWIDLDGDLRDVTPKAIPGITHVVFLSDPDLRYEGRQIDNVRVALLDDRLIEEFIETAERYCEATNRGELADFHGDLTPHLTPEITALAQERLKLEIAIRQKYDLM